MQLKVGRRLNKMHIAHIKLFCFIHDKTNRKFLIILSSTFYSFLGVIRREPQAEREVFVEEFRSIPPKRLIYLDESGVSTQKQAQAGVPVAEVIRKAGISEQTFYRWKAKYAGLEVDQVRQMAQLQEENQRLKRLVADLTLDMTMLQDVLSKNGEAFGAWTDGGAPGADAR